MFIVYLTAKVRGVRQIIVYEGLLAKFQHNASLKDYLLATGDAVLAECAVRDLVPEFCS